MLRKVLVILLILATSCIDPLEFKNMNQQKHLVVEASFTNIPELNYVRLSYAQPYDYPYNEYVTNAQVFVTSAEGERIEFMYGGDGSTFYDNTAGNYYPVSPMEDVGIVGHTYTLHIIFDGQTYQSHPVTLRPPVIIDSVHFDVDRQPFAFKGAKERKMWSGYRVLVNYHDPADEKNFLRWTFASQYEVLTQPEKATPAKDCCAQCFLEEKLDRFKVVDDRLVNGQQVINQEVLFLPFERYLNVKHKLRVYQYSITEDAYNFFRIMEQQKEAKGTVFDPPPAEVRGNMFNVEDTEDRVIGFFDAAMVDMMQVTIMRSDIDYPITPFEFPDDCRLLPGAVREPPAGWFD